MYKNVLLYSYIICLALSSQNTLDGQDLKYSIDEVNISVKGASSLHDWTAKCGEITDFPQDLMLSSNSDGTIENFGFKVAVASMDGGRGASMNDKIFKALNSEKFPYISYTQIVPADYKSDEGGSILLTSTGTLEIAGQQKNIEVRVAGNKMDDMLTLSGSYPMKLSDFDIVPPTAMFGQIKTKDDIFIHFEFRYLKDQ